MTPAHKVQKGKRARWVLRAKLALKARQAQKVIPVRQALKAR